MTQIKYEGVSESNWLFGMIGNHLSCDDIPFEKRREKGGMNLNFFSFKNELYCDESS